MTDSEAARQASGAPPTSDPEELRRDIEHTRAELGDTVEALSQKADLKARFSRKLDERKAALRGRQDDLKAKAAEARERVAGSTPDDAKRTASQLARTAEQRPLPVIAVAFAAGLLLGWLVTRS